MVNSDHNRCKNNFDHFPRKLEGHSSSPSRLQHSHTETDIENPFEPGMNTTSVI